MARHNIVTIGDPHLGHRFRTGVAHHRLGQREEVVNRTFGEQLMAAGSQGADLCVCMGDLFDTHTVDNNVIYMAYRHYVWATTKYPDTTFVLLKGNHDWHRDHRKVSSFDILHELLDGIDNIVVTLQPQTLCMQDGTMYGLFPWMPPEPHTALEWAQKTCGGRKIEGAFGHWDSMWSEHNILPAKYFASRGIKRVWSGHEHNAREVEEGGVKIIWTGSMMPYGRAQDPNHTLYRTLTLEQYKAMDSDQFHPYCYAVLLAKGEVLPYMLDAWEVRVHHELSDKQTLDEQVGYEDRLDIPVMWQKTLKQMPASVRDDVGRMYMECMQ